MALQYRNAIAFAILLAACGARALATQTPPPLPNVPLHTEVVVEVNKLGQVVRVKSTKTSKVVSFNVQTIGNALQMWIRKCHVENGATKCTAEVGLYRVIYDYDPKTHGVTRREALISSGGTWANEPGAANVMMENARKQQEEAQREARERNAKLPSLNEIRGASPSPKPSSAAFPPD